MKCTICEKEFVPTNEKQKNNKACNECIHALLTEFNNSKGDDKNE